MKSAIRVWRASRQPAPTGTWDAIIVAGARVRDDGTASPALVRRVERGVELWRAGLAPLLVMSGRGTGPRPEAVLMGEIAGSLGVPGSALALEQASMTTVENARCCRRDFTFERVIVVTCPAHVYRCQTLFGAAFREVAGVPSARGPHRNWRLFLRESAIAAWWG